ncbi:MAG: hypothetical protein OEZ13_06725 [Spirochaetia bacterium]|nr:hypothetical protein [Spirochaetia bacterium]
MKERKKITENTYQSNTVDKSAKAKLRCNFCSGFDDKIEGDNETAISKEIADMKKHELIACIASYLGSDPEYLNVAEELFEIIKYPLAEYVLKHEFNKNHNLSVQLALWLEEQSSPKAIEPIKNIVDTYLRVAK